MRYVVHLLRSRAWIRVKDTPDEHEHEEDEDKYDKCDNIYPEDFKLLFATEEFIIQVHLCGNWAAMG